jgi:hypothetical protein
MMRRNSELAYLFVVDVAVKRNRRGDVEWRARLVAARARRAEISVTGYCRLLNVSVRALAANAVLVLYSCAAKSELR